MFYFARGEQVRTHLGDILDVSGNAQNPVLNTLNDLADSGFDFVFIPDTSNGLALLTDNDTSFLGANESTDSYLSGTIFTSEILAVVLDGVVVGRSGRVHLDICNGCIR
jgi:hypothetical protein